MGSIQLSGEEHTETLCLSQSSGTANMTVKTGRLCSEKLNVVLAEKVTGMKFGQGIIGLAPKQGENNIVRKIYAQGWMP